MPDPSHTHISSDPEDATEPASVTALLECISGAHERAQLGLAQAQAGDAIELDEL
jgi:hypothetical protein